MTTATAASRSSTPSRTCLGAPQRLRHDDGWRTVYTHGETIHGRASPGYVGAAVRKLKRRLPGVSVADQSGSLFIDCAIADVVDALDGDTGSSAAEADGGSPASDRE